MLQAQHLSTQQTLEISEIASDKLKVINVQDDIQETLALIEILQKHTCENKWTLLLAPDAVPSKSLLESLSIDHSKLLIIRKRHLINIEYVVNSALKNGNFGAVVSWTNMLDEVTLSSLAANQSHFNGYFYHFAASKGMTTKPTLC
ncbi:SulA-like leucine-rich domain-containing protein [Pseudoalteromonas sp. SSM20]|uniref:SulA-like leucine-rich domain-containing protein n=1 Tax=unclassified Pseudoalteromonas TaxID=194690 RepID=UPI00237DFDB9|nr:SulA-like leucine-rich domain-containing protein [Pseudoalteromonas sp. G4]MDE3270623.1 SulA-like leucine-rich domain-containing protein [Pseudoalteromonas sp. G4]